MVLLDSENGRQIGAFTVGPIVDDHWGGGLFNVRAVSADGERLVASHQVESTHRLWLWETRTGKYHELIGHSGKVHSAAFFPDGARIITAGEDRTTRFWDSQTRSELFALRHPGPVSQVAVSPDGRSVLTVSQGSGAMLWRPAEWNIPTPEGSQN
jgi:WD40 repeat protein